MGTVQPCLFPNHYSVLSRQPSDAFMTVNTLLSMPPVQSNKSPGKV